MKLTHLVSALLDIERESLTPTYSLPFQCYLDSLKRLLRLDLPMTIHTEHKLHEHFQSRPNALTTLCRLDAETLRKSPHFAQIQAVRQSEDWRSQADWLANSPQAALEFYNPLVMHKMSWLADAARERKPDTTYLWIDAGIHKHLHAGEHAFINERYLCNLTRHPDKVFMFATPYESNAEIHGFAREAMARYCGTDFVDRCCRGGIFGGSASAILQLELHYKALMAETLKLGFMGTEESLFTILSYRHPELVEVRLLPRDFIPAMFDKKRSTLRRLLTLRNPLKMGSAMAKRLEKKFATIENSVIHAKEPDRILQLPPWQSMENPVIDLHILLCARDVIAGLWSLRTFLHFSGLSVNLMIHDDGSLTESHIKQLCVMFPQARIIPFTQAWEEMSRVLAPYPNAYRFRITEYFWSAIKLLDFAYYSEGRRFMALDADLLFFKRPDEILSAIAKGQGFFMSDWQDAYTWPLDRWPAVLGLQGIPQVNVGLFGTPNEKNFYDVNEVERCLAAYYQRFPCPRSYWLEQTVWGALFSSQPERMLRLSSNYQIADKQTLTLETCSHHYVNDSSLSRLNFTRQGIPTLIKRGFLREAKEQA